MDGRRGRTTDGGAGKQRGTRNNEGGDQGLSPARAADAFDIIQGREERKGNGARARPTTGSKLSWVRI
eukprot:4682394-Pyramimonas_sp.AAC.1